MTCRLAKPARKLAAPLSACILVLSGSGCAGLSVVGGLMTGPLPGGDGERASPPLGHCMRNWSLAECQPGADAGSANGDPARPAQTVARMPAPELPSRGSVSSPPLGHCIRSWSLPECLNGTTPANASGEPQAESSPAEPSTKPKAALGGMAVFLTMLAVALALAGPIASAVAASIYP